MISFVCFIVILLITSSIHGAPTEEEIFRLLTNGVPLFKYRIGDARFSKYQPLARNFGIPPLVRDDAIDIHILGFRSWWRRTWTRYERVQVSLDLLENSQTFAFCEKPNQIPTIRNLESFLSHSKTNGAFMLSHQVSQGYLHHNSLVDKSYRMPRGSRLVVYQFHIAGLKEIERAMWSSIQIKRQFGNVWPFPRHRLVYFSNYFMIDPRPPTFKKKSKSATVQSTISKKVDADNEGSSWWRSLRSRKVLGSLGKPDEQIVDQSRRISSYFILPVI